MRAIYEIRTREPLCDDYVGAHRDTSILNGVIVNEMPDIEIENESWTSIGDKSDKEKISWVEVPNHKVRLYYYHNRLKNILCRNLILFFFFFFF